MWHRQRLANRGKIGVGTRLHGRSELIVISSERMRSMQMLTLSSYQERAARVYPDKEFVVNVFPVGRLFRRVAPAVNPPSPP